MAVDQFIDHSLRILSTIISTKFNEDPVKLAT